nr:hypothetical protein [Oscillochloris trichoides]
MEADFVIKKIEPSQRGVGYRVLVDYGAVGFTIFITETGSFSIPTVLKFRQPEYDGFARLLNAEYKKFLATLEQTDENN